MTSKLFNATVKASRVDQQHVRLILTIGALVLFVLGAGAPTVSGGG
jgi:hypothetical protein